MKTISFINNKGGVGKTTCCASLGVLLSRMGYKVLMVDLDSQCSLTSFLLADAPGETIADTFADGVGYHAIKVAKNLDIVPSSIDMAGAEHTLARAKDGLTLKRDLAPMASNYDVCLLDCPPSYGLLLNTVIASSDHCIICCVPDVLSMKGCNTIAELCKEQGKDNKATVGVLLTMVKKNNLHDVIAEVIKDKYQDMVFSTKISNGIAVATAPLKNQTINDYQPKSKVAEEYKKLAKEIKKRWL